MHGIHADPRGRPSHYIIAGGGESAKGFPVGTFITARMPKPAVSRGRSPLNRLWQSEATSDPLRLSSGQPLDGRETSLRELRTGSGCPSFFEMVSLLNPALNRRSALQTRSQSSTARACRPPRTG